MTVRIFKPAYVIETGELGRLPDGGIVNVGGVSGQSFTVGGKGLLFADGTSTSGSTVSGITLQTVYNAGDSGNINLSPGKSFSITSLSSSGFTVDPQTGRITATGGIDVINSGISVGGQLTSSSVSITTQAANVVGISLRAATGVTPTADLVQLRNNFNGTPVLRVSASGDLFAQSLVLVGTINGINLPAFYTNFVDHISNSGVQPVHPASRISYAAAANVNVTGATVQQALDSVETSLRTMTLNGVKGYEHVQNTPSDLWIIAHGGNSRKVSVTIWDSNGEQIWPDTVRIADQNNVRVLFNTAITGRAVLLSF